MFFANPVVALRNVAAAMAPGGRIVSVVWRRREDNEWIYRAELAVKRYLEKPDDSDEPTCGPGPFSMSGADTVTDVYQHAGFTDVTLRRVDLDMLIGDSLQRAIDLNLALARGPRWCGCSATAPTTRSRRSAPTWRRPWRTSSARTARCTGRPRRGS